MGNRAVITTRENSIGIYLHWNGGRDSVEAFLKYCDLKGYVSPSRDNYGWARMAQVIANYLGGTNSIGLDTMNNLDYDNNNNGVYVIEDWKIVDRLHFNKVEQQQYELIDMMVEIDESQPKDEQLSEAFLRADIVPVEELKVGDVVFFKSWNDGVEKKIIVGIGVDEKVNGFNRLGQPYIDKYKGVQTNCNNYLTDKGYRVCSKEVVTNEEQQIKENLN